MISLTEEIKAYGDGVLERRWHTHDGVEEYVNGVGTVAVVGGDSVEML